MKIIPNSRYSDLVAAAMLKCKYWGGRGGHIPDGQRWADLPRISAPAWLPATSSSSHRPLPGIQTGGDEFSAHQKYSNINSKLLFAIVPATLPTLYSFKLKHYVDNKSYLHNIAQKIKAGVRIRVSSIGRGGRGRCPCLCDH